jgi:heme A synthase
METPINNPWLPRLAKFCVFATLALILVGAIVTTSGSGMAIATAPHAPDGALNPAGWTSEFAKTVEHGHRLIAITLATLTAILCAWLWREWIGLVIAFAAIGLAGPLGPAAAIFVIIAIVRARNCRRPITTNHWLVLVAFIAVCAQAVFGALRVSLETAGSITAATNFRTFHGVFAQAFLALMVVIAVRLCPTWSEICARPPNAKLSKFHRMAIAAQLLYFAQLACAAYLRHRDLGLLIPSWPSAQATGGLWPDAWAAGDGALRHQLRIHFLHTRILPILLTGHIIGMSIGIIKRAKSETFLTTPAKALLTMIVLQFILGVLVIWRGRQSHITNTHVIVGALICATIAMLAARTSRPSAQNVAA